MKKNTSEQKRGRPIRKSGAKKSKTLDISSGGQSQQTVITLSYPGRPVLKKNSQRMVYRGKKIVPLYSKNYAHALKHALPELKRQWGERDPIGSLDDPIHVKALFYAAKGGREPDLDGCMVGLGDLLERAGIVSNDRWIKSWDGSRIYEWGHEKNNVINEDDPEGYTYITIRRLNAGQ